jgi:hypothetical protein
MAYNLKQIFEIVKKRAKDPVKSEVRYPFTRCMYRGPNNLKCFIGELIHDEMYKPEMENVPVDLLLERYSELAEILPLEHCEILTKLQVIHDYKDPFYWDFKIQELENEVLK